MGLAGQKLGSYELIAEIARGSTTDLVLARTRGIAGFERHVVIKRVRDERAGDAAFVEAFVTEARLAATLHHHNVVQVQDINEANGVPYFAMEYVHGEDLRALLAHVHARKEQIPIQHVLTIGCAVAAGLHHAHEQKTPDGKPLNLVHRDVTPANILVGYDGNVKIVDFGMAKAAITSVTQVGIKKGKAPYMAPEQCAGQRVDRRSDVFALGIVLYELVTARRLFKGASDHDTMMTIVHGSMPPPRVMRPDLPLELSSVIAKALARLPADRYQTAAELGHALETYGTAAGLGISTSALAAYLKQQLGERREPWLPGGSVRTPAPVDFDGAELGVASPAGESIPTTPRRDIPTMPAEIASASAPVVPPSEDDHDENEPTAKDGPTKAKAEAAAKAAASAAPKKLDPAAFAPKPAAAKPAATAKAAPTPGAAKPLPSITKAAVPTGVPDEESDPWSVASEPTRVDDDLGDEAATSEMTRDEVAAAVGKPAAGAIGPKAADPKAAPRNGAAQQPAPVDAFAPTTAAQTVATSATNDAVPTRPTPQPVAKIALAKAPARSVAAPDSAPAPGTTKAPADDELATTPGARKTAANDAAASAPGTAKAGNDAAASAPGTAKAIAANSAPATTKGHEAATAPATAKNGAARAIDAATTKAATAAPAIEAAATTKAATVAKPKLPPPSTSKSAPFAKLAQDANDLEIPNESGMRPGTDLEIPTEVGDEPRRPRSDTAEPLPAPPSTTPAPPSTTAETAAGRPARRTKSVSSEMSPTAGGAIVVETRTKTAGDLTLPVTPLPLELPVTAVPDPKVSRRRNLLLAGVGGVALFAAIAGVIAFSGGASQAGAKPAEIAQAVEPATPAAKAPEPEPATAPAGEMTWNGVLDAGAAEAKPPEPAVTPTEPAAASDDSNAKPPEPAPAGKDTAKPAEPAPAGATNATQPDHAPIDKRIAKPDEPVAKPLDPALADKHVATQPEASTPDREPAKEPVKAAAVRPVKKPVVKPKPKPVAKPARPKTKPAEKPADKPVQYDPNSLFLGK